METYKNILVAVELNDAEDKLILERAKEIAKHYQATLHLVHAVEHINTYGTATAYPAIAEVEEELTKEHKEKLQRLGSIYNISPSQQYLDLGAPAIVIKEAAEKIHANLIITGSHGRHGLAALLGTTADTVLHRANCDILVVHLPKK